MYYPSRYNDHNQSLTNFQKEFNRFSAENGGRFKIIVNENENYENDGIIFDNKTQQQICFDWEKRYSYYNTCGFPFKTFGQFERKIQKDYIDLSIQCSKDERCFCIAWHEDLKKENPKRINSKTEKKTFENNCKRFTTHFKEFKCNKLDEFIRVLEKAFDERNFNKNSWVKKDV